MGLQQDTPTAEGAPPPYRYLLVLAMLLLVVVFVIAAPSANWSRGVAILIEGLTLAFTAATTRGPDAQLRRRLAITLGLVLSVTAVSVMLGAPRPVGFCVAVVVTAAIPVMLVRGLLRLMRDHGVTVHAVAGALSIYLTIGLIFAWLIGAIAAIAPDTAFFVQHSTATVTEGDRVYYSFTVLTTTGFGDYTPRTSIGHALAVIEMLTGQIYLVTVIGLLIGNFTSTRRGVASPPPD